MSLRPLASALLAAGCALAAPLASAAPHTLDFDQTAAAQALTVGTKTWDNGVVNLTDRVLRDGLGREVVLRGWNVSGSTKLVETGFKPFRNADDARASLTALRERTGANAIRFLVSWEGVNPQVDTVDTAYLAAITEQIRIATQLDMYVLIDWHEDLFSRHLFNADSWHTGNGAPAWVIEGSDYPDEYCGIVCATWSQNNLTNEAVRRAARNFWNNATISTANGPRTLQESFLWQLESTLVWLKANLAPAEYAYVLGVDPWNEPVDGGMEGLTPAQWDNQKLWPFYRKVRTAMDRIGWNDKPVYAEPLVFWNTTAGVVAPATGGHHLIDKPAAGFVFNAHFYDAGRMGTDGTALNNGSYLMHMHQVRDEARWLGMPPFLSEFGMWLAGTGPKDTNRMIAAIYQGLEASDALKPAKDRFTDPYSPPVSATQWHWDWYHDRHSEIMNGNPSKLLTDNDAWNDENFSVISVASNGAVNYNIDARNIERAYPRAAQGDILAFQYNALVRDAGGTPLPWLALRPLPGDREYFRNERWALLVWRGRASEAPTEIFLPASFSNIAVVTDKRVLAGLATTTASTGFANEILLLADNAGGRRLLVWDDIDSGETATGWHYVLVVNRDSGAAIDTALLNSLKTGLDQTLVAGRHSATYFTGSMTNGGYAADSAPKTIALTASTYQVLWWKYINFSWDGATGDVDILVKGARTETGGASGSRTAWNYSGTTTYQVCERGGRRCSNVYTAK